MNLVFELLVGAAAGAHISTWGMYKDSIHEGFTVPRYLRSTFVGLFWAPVAARFLDIDATAAQGIVVLFGLTYALERATTEFWKTFIRDEDQSKYFIPMQFHVFGHVPRNRFTRLAVGLGYVGVALVLLRIVQSFQPPPGQEGPLWQVLLVASIGGWYSACGGAFKDAPIEGFEWMKFFRSPVSATFYGFLISQFTNSYVLIALCAIGYTVATLETYKTFFFPSVPRGKFAGKPITNPEMLKTRQKFVPLYVAIWIGIVTSFTLAFVQLDGRGPTVAPFGGVEVAGGAEGTGGATGGAGSAVLAASDGAPIEAAGTMLVELWRTRTPAFGVFVPNERERGATGPGGERLPPLHTVDGGLRLAASPLYDYLFLNLEGGWDPDAVSAIARGLESGAGGGARKTLLVRIPPISADGEEAARVRVREALERGADGVVLPHVRSAAEARTAVGFFAGADVWSPSNPDGSVIAMLMLEDPDAVEQAAEIAAVPGYSVLACGIGSLTRALEGDRAAAEAGNRAVLRHATEAGLADMITANGEDVAARIEEGFLALLMQGDAADEAIAVGRRAAGR